jgi:hypothetical protein
MAKSRRSAKVGVKEKRKAVAEVFGAEQVDAEDIDFINFMYARRGLATVPEDGHRELRYIVEITDLEQVIWQTLDLIHERDGERFWREAASYLQRAVSRVSSGHWSELTLIQCEHW